MPWQSCFSDPGCPAGSYVIENCRTSYPIISVRERFTSSFCLRAVLKSLMEKVNGKGDWSSSFVFVISFLFGADSICFQASVMNFEGVFSSNEQMTLNIRPSTSSFSSFHTSSILSRLSNAFENSEKQT